MNTIVSVKPYINTKNNTTGPMSQPVQTSTPAFKGVIGQQVVKDITAKKAVTATSILALVGGIIGLSKDKVSDVFESLIEKVNGLMGEKAELEQQNLELKKTLVNTKSEKDMAKQEIEVLKTNINGIIAEKNEEIAAKDAKIAELQEYEAMAGVKSIGELDDIITPEQFINLINETKEAAPNAEKSLENFLFIGNGQEEFLTQMARINKLNEAKNLGMTNIPEMNDAFIELEKSIFVHKYPGDTMLDMMQKVLKSSEKGYQVAYPPIKNQIMKNADALAKVLDKKFGWANSESVKERSKNVFESAIKFHNGIATEKKKLESQGWKYADRNVHKNGKIYYTFNKEGGCLFKIYLEDLSVGLTRKGLMTNSEGVRYSDMPPSYWD